MVCCFFFPFLQISDNSLDRSKIDDRTGQMRPDSSASDTDGHLRDLKRQKKLDYRPGTNSELELKFMTPPNESFTNSTICAFCQSSRVSEVNFSYIC